MTQAKPQTQTHAPERAETPRPSSVDDHVGDMHAPDLYVHDAVAEPLDGLDAITDKHIHEVFPSQGFLAVENAFTPEEAEAAKQGMRDLAMGRNPEFTGIQFEKAVQDKLDQLSAEQRLDGIRKLMSFCKHEPRLAHLAEHPKLLEVLRRLLGDREPKLFQDMGLSKPPKIGREKPWHQDCAYFNLAPGTPVVGVWIALDEATIDNGCMRLLGGGHHIGPVHHWKRRDWQICDTDFYRLHDKEHPVIAAPLKPGGLLLFSGMLPHGTPHNNSGQRRRAVQYHYCPADAEWTETEERLAIYGTEGKDVEC
ncbi:MAG: phytanoyl-CoA dioxygenase family protein [Phycisphaeraceae bacterium]